MNTLPKALFVSHGGGPMPLLGDKDHADMVHCLQSLGAEIPKPKAIVVVSAHWESDVVSITSGAAPEMIYDYYGFPKESYEFKYPAPGHPELAAKLHARFQAAGIESRLDESRGFDHGLFVPLMLMWPQADIPCIQVSLVNNLDPKLHIAMGKALGGLNEQGVLLVGSGFTFHNMKAFFNRSEQAQVANRVFEDWVVQVVGNENLSEEARATDLADWVDAPGATFSHPREEHLMPLHVCYGAAQSAYSKRIELTILNRLASMIVW